MSATAERIWGFFFPKTTRVFWLRLVVVAVTAYIVFGHLLIPVVANGRSMEPTYRNRSFNFCWRLRFAFREPAVGDVVMVRFAGRRVMLFKRVVALEGDTVAFRDGVLYVNGKAVDEPYVKLPCDWDLEPRTVKPGNVYVIGDNRSTAIGSHRFGQTPLKRIMGGPLW